MEQDQQRQGSRMSDIPGHISAFIKTKIAYYKLVAAEGASGAASGAILGITLFLLGIFFLIFLSVAAALGLGYLLDNHAWGFLIVAGVYLLIAVIIFTMRDTLIITPVTNAIISKMAADNSADEPEDKNSDSNDSSNNKNETHEKYAYNGYEEPAGREGQA